MPLDAPRCRRCGVPLSEVGTAGSTGRDLCTRCRTHAEAIPMRSTVGANRVVVDRFLCLGEEFDD
jgi:recombinational DNA repair protein (RecF pathway)